MEFKKLGEENIDSYIAYLERAMEEEPDMMTAESVEEEGIRGRIKDPFYQNSVSLLAMEDGQVLGRIEYHFYGCLQDGYRMAYVDWVYVLKAHRHRGIARALFRAFEEECRANRIDHYFLIRSEEENADRFYRKFQNAELSSVPVLRKELGESCGKKIGICGGV